MRAGSGERGATAREGMGDPGAELAWRQRADGAAPASQTLRQALDNERPRFFLWAPVWLGSGIALYFGLLQEPGFAVAVAPAIVFLILLAAVPRGSLAASVAIGFTLAAAGFLAAKMRVDTVSAPVLTKQLTSVELTGRIERIEPRTPHGERLTIAVERLGTLSDSARPVRVRVRTMNKSASREPLRAGQHVSLKATLSPPAKPAIPGGFDFARTAYFEQIGGVGYTYAPVNVLTPAPTSTWSGLYIQTVEAVRAALNQRIKAALPGETGAIAAALITGERGGISDATNDAYRNAGLFHILSISGLHMVIMAGAVFYCVRLVLAAVPSIAGRFAIKKWAAAAGILAALLYLAISGGAFATVRSAVQIIIMFFAILLDRPALALRNVALAAFAILLVYPESLFDPGFQMSFAAVAALIAAYEEVRRRTANPATPHPVLSVLMFFGGIVLSTLIASVAVAPFAAYHFHQSQQYAVIANLLAIPICNFIVMPAALGALLLMPLGLEGLALFVMGKGIDAMTWCAGIVAKLPGAVVHVRAMPELAFVLLLLGGLWLVLWQARWRLAGLAVATTGVLLAPALPLPDVLVARGGELVAVRGSDGALSALPARRSKFELERWLEHDGDRRTAAEAAKAQAFKCDSVGCVAHVKGLALAVLRHPAAMADDCESSNVLVLNVPKPPRACDHPAKVIDVFDIWREGTHALYVEESEDGAPRIRVETVAAVRGDRPWSPRLRPPESRRPAKTYPRDATPVATQDATPSEVAGSGVSIAGVAADKAATGLTGMPSGAERQGDSSPGSDATTTEAAAGRAAGAVESVDPTHGSAPAPAEPVRGAAGNAALPRREPATDVLTAGPPRPEIEDDTLAEDADDDAASFAQ